MGSTPFTRIAYGTSPEEAYNNADDETQSEYGYQNKYSGDLNSKPGFVLAHLPEGVNLSAWIVALKTENMPLDFPMHAKVFEAQQDIYEDKWGPALCFEVPDTTQKIWRKTKQKKYIFLGYAPE